MIEEAYAQAFQYMSINSITQSTEDLREIRKTMIKEVNETKKQFAGVILHLAEALQKSGSPEVLKTIMLLCEQASRELRMWNPETQSTPLIEVF